MAVHPQPLHLLELFLGRQQQQERTTLINPGAPNANAAVHGIDDALASSAPAFVDVAPELAALQQGRFRCRGHHRLPRAHSRHP